MQPLVSVIMPVYNCESYVSQAIQSVIDQRYSNWELIIVNDGSTDNSMPLITQFNDQRIHIHSQKNCGVSAARNLGLKSMRGSYFCFLDADDVLPENSIESRMKTFNDIPDVQFVDGLVKIYDHTLTTLLATWKPRYTGNPKKELVKLSGRCFFGPTWMVKRSPGVNYSFREGMTHCEDLLFYITIGAAGKYASTDNCVLMYRKNAASTMSNLEGLGRGYRQLIDEVFKHFGAEMNVAGRLFFVTKIRKIMFLSFVAKREYVNAFKYLFYGII